MVIETKILVSVTKLLGPDIIVLNEEKPGPNKKLNFLLFVIVNIYCYPVTFVLVNIYFYTVTVLIMVIILIFTLD